MTQQKYVLVTGASSGIGLRLTQDLVKHGFSVIAGVRTSAGLQAILQLNNPHIIPIILDVTNHEQITEQFLKFHPLLEQNGLYALINNAGIAVPGPLEFISLSLLDKQLHTNVIGVVAITQAALPYLRKSKGRIINIGSISGRLTSPFLGAYSASKFALRAITQIMRMELRPWHIAVTLIESGNINTGIWTKGISFLQDSAVTSINAKMYYGSALQFMMIEAKKKVDKAGHPQRVTNVILKCLSVNKLKPCYLVGKDAWFLFFFSKFFPSEIINRFYKWILKKRRVP